MGKPQLEAYLEDLESRIDDNTEYLLYNKWLDFVDRRHKNGIFKPERSAKTASKLVWPEISINEALNDYDMMALQQYAACSSLLNEGGGDLLCVRANYGTSILPSLFGVELFIMDEKCNTLPGSKPVKGGTAALGKLIDRGVPDICSGYGEKVFEMGRRFKRIGEAYPKIGRHVHIYHPDLQGPMDICEVLAGSDIFLIIMDEPEFFKELLELITETYIKFMKEWLRLFPYNGNNAVHWGWLHKGCIMIRNDSLMNLSPSTYKEQIMPFDQKLYDTFGGGAMHFCGRGDHYIGHVSCLEGITAINMSQPELNRQDNIFRNTVYKGIHMIGYKAAGEDYLQDLGETQNLVHCRA